MDYNLLTEMLIASQWRQADEQTGAIMLKIAGRIAPDWLREEDITNFPSLDLRTIDYLWVKHSQGRFGFSVQSSIWENLAPDYLSFSDTVGWRSSSVWQNYSQLIFNLEAPKGHLPASPFFKSDLIVGWLATMTPKLADCYADDF